MRHMIVGHAIDSDQRYVIHPHRVDYITGAVHSSGELSGHSIVQVFGNMLFLRESPEEIEQQFKECLETPAAEQKINMRDFEALLNEYRNIIGEQERVLLAEPPVRCPHNITWPRGTASDKVPCNLCRRD